MIQKNIEEDVGKYTAIAAEQVRSLSINDELDDIFKTAENALKDACNLKGVGPATGSLVLSISAPNVIPFFEDELFKWLVPEHKTKLKYDKKEYGLMLRPALELMRSQSITAQEVEKIAYVVVHSQYLDDKQRESLKE